MILKTLRRILFIILCIALIAISVGFLLPGKVHVERRLLISAPQRSIFKQVNVLENWVKWSPWLQADTTMQLLYSGPVSGVGSTLKWLSNNTSVGRGSLSIISSVPYDSIQLLLDYGKNGKSTTTFHLTKENQNTLVTSSLDSDLGMNPISRWFGLFSDYMVGPDLERGLFNLSQYSGNIKTVNGYEIIDSIVPAHILLTVRDTASPETIKPKLAGMYQRISKFLKSRNLSPTGSPIAVFHNYSNLQFDIEACMPVASIVAVPNGMNCIEKDAQKTIMVKYFGPYDLISGAYNAMQTYINDRELQITGPAWEEYVTNPNKEVDSTKWQTNIYYPLNSFPGL